MKIERILEGVKIAVYLAAGIVILIFNEALMDYIGPLVGGVMLLYALEGIAVRIGTGQAEKHLLGFIDEVILLLLAVLVILVRDNLEKTCVIWAIWSILREGEEIAVVLKKYKRRSVWIISLVESVVVIGLSSFLVLAPMEHAHSHIIILGIEMILEVVFPLLDGQPQISEEFL